MNVTTIYGASTPPGRLAGALSIVEHTLYEKDVAVTCIRPLVLETETSHWADWPQRSEEVIGAADALLIASPVYRASVPATLKALFDTLSVEALRSKPIATVVVGHAAEHYLAARRHLVDILEWFGALVLPSHVYIEASEFDGTTPQQPHVDRLHALSASVTALADATKGLVYTPPPLSAQTH